jgi:histidine phosphotransferase ChpT
LAELLCARLCHDMAGPVGAAAAGAELIADMEGDVDSETVSLVSASAQAGAARLKFFRQALGPAVAGMVSTQQLRDIVAAYLESQASAVAGIGMDWQVSVPGLAGEDARLLLNFVLLAKDSLPRGGTVRVSTPGGAVSVAAFGVPVELPAEARAVLADGEAPSSPRGAQAALTRLLAENEGKLLVVDSFDGGIGFAVAPGK